MNTPDAPSRRTGPGLARRVATTLACFLVTLPAAAQSPVDDANAFYAQIPEPMRSDLVILPVLADIERPPIGAENLRRVMLMPAGSTNWARAEAWATAPAQAAVLEALSKVTQGDDLRGSMVFAQPYGPGVPRALIAKGMYTDLGDPPSLAAASFGYRTRLSHLESLVNVEATRRAAAGDPAGAIKVLIDWLFFCRQIADREFLKEAQHGAERMVHAFERIRDIAYQDMRGPRALTTEQISAIISRLDDRKILQIDRLTLPRADRISARQLISRVFDRSGTINPAAFASAMAAVGSADRPLRLFAEAARWSGATGMHADRAATERMLDSVISDWEARWRLDPFDQRHNTPTVYAQSVEGNPAFAVLDAALDEMGAMIELRQQLRAEAAGTRAALGIVGFFYQTRQLPPTLASIRPRWIPELEADPYNPDRGRERRPPLEYFVPVRDTAAQGGGPHEMNVVAYDSNFRLRLGQDQFVLYSVGPDRRKDWARFVSNDPGAVRGDYLFWPPVISLLRIDLDQQGMLE